MNRLKNESEYELFQKRAALSMEEICREIYRENRERIRIKKENVAVKNLVKIFNATLSLSAKKGFQAMSLRDLCKESGLSMGALYAYFTEKDMLLDIILLQGRRIIKKILDEALASESSLWGKLSAAIRTHIFLSEVLQEWFFFSFMEAKNLSREKQKAAIASELYTEKIFIDVLEKGIARDEFAPMNAVLTASVIKAMLQDWYLKRWKYRKRGVSVEEYANFVTDIVGMLLLAGKTEKKQS
jgi:AcrR family transcriptional regulator